MPVNAQERRMSLNRDSFSITQKDDKPVIEGYAAMFNKRTVIWDWFEEEIDERAFDNALSNDPYVRALFNHDPNQLLGTTRAGTLSLRADATGLMIECFPSTETSVGKNVVEWLKRKELDGQSFAFTIKRQEWIFADNLKQMDLRRILEVGELYDVGPVTYPAYSQTSVKLREEAKQLHDEARRRFEARSNKSYYRNYTKIGDNVVEAGVCAFECRSQNGDWIEEEILKSKQEAIGNETKKEEAVSQRSEEKDPENGKTKAGENEGVQPEAQGQEGVSSTSDGENTPSKGDSSEGEGTGTSGDEHAEIPAASDGERSTEYDPKTDPGFLIRELELKKKKIGIAKK